MKHLIGWLRCLFGDHDWTSLPGLHWSQGHNICLRCGEAERYGHWHRDACWPKEWHRNGEPYREMA
jgi:hypothetical protein